MTRDDQSTIALCKEIDATIATYQRRLKKYTREENPKKWTQVNNEFGNEFYQAGVMIGDTTCLDQSIRAYRKVLEVYTQEDHPHDFAITQNNLGNALSNLGEITDNLKYFEDAIIAYRKALLVHTAKHFPVGYIMAQNNLANAIRHQAEHYSDADLMAQAVDAYRKAVEASQLEELSENWPLLPLQLIRALTRLGELDANLSFLEEARRLANEALVSNPENNVYEEVLEQIDASIEQLASRSKAQ